MVEALFRKFRERRRRLVNALVGRDFAAEFGADLSGMILILNRSDRILIDGVNYKLYKNGILYHRTSGLNIDSFVDSIPSLFSGFVGIHQVYSGKRKEKHYFDLSCGRERDLAVDYTLRLS